ncbi:MAG TPA: alpha/beta hydrolase [Bacteroidia bacterium]|nr:alpha/beta hydrolase [Bacteroidota bacterium]HQW21859.1 alpha/beta hydrolase [Bacteroidia bacterium]
MNLNKFFFLIAAFLILIAAFINVAPTLITGNFIYPTRIDSTYIRFHSIENSAIDTNLMRPSDVGLDYSELSLKTASGELLKGWYIPTTDTPANTILIIHDLNQSKLMMLDQIKQLHDRGMHVCIFDLRAHGESGGEIFTIGMPAVGDMKLITDTLLTFLETKHIVLFGMGIGSAIAMQSAVFDGRCDAIVLQSPFNNLDTYLSRYSYKKWGNMKYLWYPIFRKKVEKLLEYPVSDLDLTKIAAFNELPILFITASDDDEVFTSETLQIFLASASQKKDLFLVKKADHNNIALVGGEKYYNRISNFINTVLPREPKKTRYKKLAFNDYERNN